MYSRHIWSSSSSNRASSRPSTSASESSESYAPSISAMSSSESRAASSPGAAAFCTASRPPLDLMRAREKRSISLAPMAPSSSWPWRPRATRMRSFALIFAFFFLSRRARASTPRCNSAISPRSFSSSSSAPPSASSSAPESAPESSSSSDACFTTPPRSAALRLPSSPRDLRTARRHLSSILKSARPSTPRSEHNARISSVVEG